MKFKLSTSEHFYPDKKKRDLLAPLGFTFKPSKYLEFTIEGSPEIEIDSLKELMAFTKKYGDIIIMDDAIEIYNGYRE